MSRVADAASAAATGSVTIHPNNTFFKASCFGFSLPTKRTPMSAPELTCVVDTGKPSGEAASTSNEVPRFATTPEEDLTVATR